MTKKLMMNKPSNIIDDYKKWFQIYELSGAFNTIEDSGIDEEGRIYIDEIWGNTWQDSDSKNLFDIDSLQMVGNNAEKGIIDTEKNSITFNYENVRDCGCETNFIFESGKKYKISADVEYNNDNNQTRLMCIGPVGLGFEYHNELLKLIVDNPNYSERRFAVSAVIPDDGKQYALYLNGNNYQNNVTGNTIFKNIVIEEVDNTTDTTKPTEYIPYHKGDLSNIQHVGELISVDGGQEQYKVEIEVCNKNLINQPLVQGRWEVTKGVFEPGFNGNVCCKELIKIQPNTIYQFSSSEGYRKALFFDKNKKYIKYYPLGERETELNSYNTPKNAEYVALTIDKKGITINTTVQLEQGAKATDYTPHESHKQTILLPCQLMKVGNVRDRLYWDIDEGRYMVEKNIGFITRNSNNNYRVTDAKKENVIIFECTDTVSDVKQPSAAGIATVSNLIKSCRTDTWNADSEGIHFMNAGSRFQIKINKSRLDPLDSDGLKDFILKNGDQIRLYYHLQTPELIGTDITERIELPCYNPTTHITINSGNIEPSNIKALVPMKTLNTVVTNGLICWLEANDLSGLGTIKNGTIWKNRVKNGSNAIIRTINGNDIDGVKNGYFRTHKNAYVELPSFKANDVDGITIFVDGKMNQRYNSSYGRIFTLQQNSDYMSGFSINYGVSEFGHIRYFIKNHAANTLGTINQQYPFSFKIGINSKIATNFTINDTWLYGGTGAYDNIFSNNYLNAENPTTLNEGDISYRLVLIYNRDLSEEEMRQNYEYSKLIQRG